jgi:dienelactone hydrolase
MKKTLRRIACATGGLLVAIIVALALLKVVLDARYFSGYDAKAPLSVKMGKTDDFPTFTRTPFYYHGFRDQRVPGLMAMPKDLKGPRPCVIFLHGIGDDKDFMKDNHLDEPFLEAGFAFVTFDQLMRGERQVKGGWTEAKAFYRRAAHTVNDTRRMVDYLATRPDIDTARIYLCGASYGAITGAIATAFEPRIRAAVLTYGGGNLTKMLTAPEIRAEIGGWLRPAQALAWYFGGVTDPLRYVGRIAPRPVLLQNGKADTVILPVCAKALQDAARDPKKILWYDGDHLGKTDDLDIPLATAVLKDARAFLQDQDARIRAERVKPRN